MAPLTLEGYLTKTQVQQKFGRHPRTLTKDVSKSLECRDEELLSLCRLKRQSGEVLEGSTITPELRDSLVGDGENPQWYFLPEFVETVVKRQAPTTIEMPKEGTVLPKKKSSSINSTASQQSSLEEESTYSIGTDLSLPQLPKDAVERAAILEHLYLEKSRELIKERSRYDDLVPIIKDIPKQTEKMVEAMQGLQALFANTQEREKALNPGKVKQATIPNKKSSVTSAEVIEADIVVNTTPKQKASPPVKSTSAKTSRASKKKRTANQSKKPKTASKRARKKTVTRSVVKKPETFVERNLPNFVALLGRRSK